MLRYVAWRLVHGIAIIFVVTATVFFVTRLIGDPVRQMLPLGASEAQQQDLRRVLGLDEPIPEQFISFASDLVRFDFGESLWQRGVPAGELVFDRLPATFQLVGVGLLIALVVFVPLGLVASMRPGSLTDRLVVTGTMAGLSMPQFWLGAMLIAVFSVQLGWLPTSGSGSWKHLVLPGSTLALTAGGRIAQITRSAMIEQLSMPYVRTGLAHGFSRGYMLRVQVFRNAAIPVFTTVAWEFAYAMAGYAVIIETVFAWPGIGRLIVQAILFQDFVLVQTAVFVVALIVVGTNLVTDIAYKYIDPRVQM